MFSSFACFAILNALMDRREFIKGSAWMGALAAFSGCCAGRLGFGAGGSMHGFHVAPMKFVRVGIIGTDTWHAREFTRLLNIETNRTEFAGFKVTAAYRWGSRDIPGSLKEAEDYIPQLKAWGIEFVDSIAELLKRVDVVLLETNDGREHLAQAEEVFRSGKPVFIDKPVAESFAAVEAIDRLAKKYGRRWYSSSGLRFQRAIRRARRMRA